MDMSIVHQFITCTKWTATDSTRWFLGLGFPYSNVTLANIRYQTSEISDAPEQQLENNLQNNKSWTEKGLVTEGVLQRLSKQPTQ
jgi:hypothetical protein